MMKLYKAALGAVIGLALLGCAPQSEPAKTQSADNEQVQAIAQINPIIKVTRAGNPEGRTVILIPGLASSPEVWAETSAELQNFDLRLVHIAGFAGLDAVEIDGELITDRAARDLLEHLSKDPGRDAVIIGHSMGGFTALKTALLADGEITELIIVDSLPYLAEMMMPGIPPENVETMATMLGGQMKTMARENFDAQQAMGVARMAKTESYHDYILKWGQSSDQAFVADAMAELLSADLRDAVSGISAKTTILAAWDPAMGVEEDQIRTLYADQYSKLPDHNLIVIKDSYHFIMYDQFGTFIDIVKDTLE